MLRKCSRDTSLPWSSLQSCTELPNGRRCRVQQCWVWWGELFSTSEAEKLTGPEHRDEAAGGGQPQMVFHLLCFHTELPSSQLWESALRASSDPPGSAFVTTHPYLSSSLCSVSVLFLPFPLFCGCIYSNWISSLLISDFLSFLISAIFLSSE